MQSILIQNNTKLKYLRCYCWPHATTTPRTAKSSLSSLLSMHYHLLSLLVYQCWDSRRSHLLKILALKIVGKLYILHIHLNFRRGLWLYEYIDHLHYYYKWQRLLSYLFNHHFVKLMYDLRGAFRFTSTWDSFKMEDLRI